jgi:maltose alpha-D-glucosyltransferase/alpha-amylase
MTAPQFDTQVLDRLRDACGAQLPAFLPSQRWFGGKARVIQSVALADCVPIPLRNSTALILLVRVEYAQGPGETYALPLLLRPHAAHASKESNARILEIPDVSSPEGLALTDAFDEPEFLSCLVRSIQAGVSYLGSHGEFRAQHTAALSRLLSPSEQAPAGRRIRTEQSNTSILYGEYLILKFFRKLAEGTNPDLEIGCFLAEEARFANIPLLGGFLEYCSRDGKSMTAGMLQAFVPNRGDAWRHTLASLHHFLSESAGYLGSGDSRATAASAIRSGGPLRGQVVKLLEEQLQAIGLLGQRTAELHRALASGKSGSEFSPEPITSDFRESLKREIHDLIVRNFDLLREKLPSLPGAAQELASKVLDAEDDVLLECHSVLEGELLAARTRIHGDYHLGQVLFTGNDYFIIDFEGEPARPLAERRAKKSPLQDVAGMLRSFQYVAHAAVLATEGQAHVSSEEEEVLEILADRWLELVSHRFLDAYRRTAEGASFLPANSREFDALLRVHLLEKAIYELGYELNNRPDWLPIPLIGIQNLLRRNSS